MRYLTAALAALSLVCAGGAAASNAVVVNGWTIDEDVGRFNFSRAVTGSTNIQSQVPEAPYARILYLVRQPDGTWQASLQADASQPGVEAIWLNGANRTLGLAAMGTALTTKGDQQSVCNMRQTGDRSKVGYSLCNSVFAREIKDLGVLLTPLHVLTGKIGAYRADSEKLSAALSGANIDQLWAEVDRQTAAAQQQASQQVRAQVQAEAQALTQWRAGLREGVQTLCGPVIEAKTSVVAISVRGRGVVWQTREQVQPPGAATDGFMAASYCSSL